MFAPHRGHQYEMIVVFNLQTGVVSHLVVDPHAPAPPRLVCHVFESWEFQQGFSLSKIIRNCNILQHLLYIF